MKFTSNELTHYNQVKPLFKANDHAQKYPFVASWLDRVEQEIHLLS